MAESKDKPIKEEVGDDEDDECDDYDGPISSSTKSKLSKKNELEDDDEDNPRIALSKSKKKNPVNPNKVQKEAIDDGEDDHKLLKKKEGGRSNAKLSKVKKEEIDLSDEEKPRKRNTKPAKAKREVTDDSEEEEEKVKKKKNKKKEAVKMVNVMGKASKDRDVQVKKREKKVYDLPGQKHDPPEERDPLRIFYESLHEQIPGSEMAAFWMMEWGLLPADEAKKVYANKLKKSPNQKIGSPVKVVSVTKTSTVSVKKVKQAATKTVTKMTKARDNDPEAEEDDEDDFILSNKKRLKVSS